MKDWLTYIAPVVRLTVLVYCDFVFTLVNYFNRDPKDIIYNLLMVVVYNVLVVMSVWCLMAAMCMNPG